MARNSQRNRFASSVVLVLVLALVLLCAVSCGKKESKAPATTQQTTVSAPVETKKAEVKPAEVKKTETTAPVEEKKSEEAPVVEVKTEGQTLEIKVEVPKASEPASLPEGVIALIEKTYGNEKFTFEAHDGYGFVYYPESYKDEEIDALLDNIVSANPDISDVVGWSIEEPGMMIVAYPYGLTGTELTAYAEAFESMLVK